MLPDATESGGELLFKRLTTRGNTSMKWFGKKTAKYLGIDINKNVTNKEFKSLRK